MKHTPPLYARISAEDIHYLSGQQLACITTTQRLSLTSKALIEDISVHLNKYKN